VEITSGKDSIPRSLLVLFPRMLGELSRTAAAGPSLGSLYRLRNNHSISRWQFLENGEPPLVFTWHDCDQ
jgi:hypothetical protein